MNYHKYKIYVDGQPLTDNWCDVKFLFRQTEKSLRRYKNDYAEHHSISHYGINMVPLLTVLNPRACIR